MKTIITLFSLITALTSFAPPAFAAVATTDKPLSEVAAQVQKNQITENNTDNERVSINSASAEELAQVLNGVGIKKAQAIISYRDEHGQFKSIDDLRLVPGIGNALVERNLARLKL